MPSTRPKAAEGTDTLSEHKSTRLPAILAVDDTPENLDILADLLSEYRLSVATDGEGALELADTEQFNLFLLDIMMPGMDGFELCRRLQASEKNRNVPIIFLTALTEIPSLEMAFALGGVDYVTKPFRPPEMLARVKTHLQLYAMRTRLAETVEAEIAKRQRQERVLQRQARLAAMGEMLDAVAHQWNQPLSVIALQNDLLSLLEPDPTDGQIGIHCNIIRTQITHMQETLYDFRQFLRPSGTVTPVRTHTLIETVQILLRGPLQGAGVSLQTQGIPEDAELHVNASEFTHVLINLIANAVDAYTMNAGTPPHRIRFVQRERNREAVLIIEDDAGGIPPALLPDIFEADISGKPAGEGSGIGLYMSRLIVEKQGGSIIAANTTTGAKFTIILPEI